MKITKSDIITTDGYLEFCHQNNICYIKADFFYGGPFIWRGLTHPTHIKEVCVVGHSDYPITDDVAKKFKKIFCINRSTDSLNVYGIPLGITNDCDDSPTHRIYGNKQIMIDVMNESLKKKNLAYMNFNISTYPVERKYIFDKFINCSWVKTSPIQNTLDGRRNFLRNIKKSKFVFCPRGNGIDTHRLWETLYMGSIPIVKIENTHHLFTDLPILFIKDWNEVTEEMLNQKYHDIIGKEWNFEKLKISYWNDFIKMNS